ncbi:NADH dehydrogenase subunit 2 [Stylosanthes scabra]|uniref:NADH dehydrogenase subunit 2 n=1 Tax=Stylosanthes scabra TaxID=79078 RepID=A0ABU6SQ92_9FABA|nr:NADH dehydrogenase subunit 2 [Stylosanthes scabra]
MHNALPPPPEFHHPKAMIANPSTLNDQSWYADSGASHHCTPDASNLHHSTNYQGQELVIPTKFYSRESKLSSGQLSTQSSAKNTVESRNARCWCASCPRGKKSDKV